MADTKQGRTKKALAREKRQLERELQADLEGMDDPEPVEPDDLEDAEGNA